MRLAGDRGHERAPPHCPLAATRRATPGDGVAVVVAETRALAKDAAELVEVDYEPLPAVTTSRRRSPTARRSCTRTSARTSCYVWKLAAGDVGRRVRRGRRDRVTERYRQPRLIPNAIEPRGVLAQPSAATGDVTV